MQLAECQLKAADEGCQFAAAAAYAAFGAAVDPQEPVLLFEVVEVAAVAAYWACLSATWCLIPGLRSR